VQADPTPGNWSCREAVTLFSLRIGHSRLTYEHIFTRDDAPTCDNCDEDVTIGHVFRYADLDDFNIDDPKHIFKNRDSLKYHVFDRSKPV